MNITRCCRMCVICMWSLLWMWISLVSWTTSVLFLSFTSVLLASCTFCILLSCFDSFYISLTVCYCWHYVDLSRVELFVILYFLYVILSHFIIIVDIRALLTKYMSLFFLLISLIYSWMNLFLYVVVWLCISCTCSHSHFPIWFNCSPLPQIHASWGCQSLVGLDVWR